MFRADRVCDMTHDDDVGCVMSAPHHQKPITQSGRVIWCTASIPHPLVFFVWYWLLNHQCFAEKMYVCIVYAHSRSSCDISVIKAIWERLTRSHSLTHSLTLGMAITNLWKSCAFTYVVYSNSRMLMLNDRYVCEHEQAHSAGERACVRWKAHKNINIFVVAIDMEHMCVVEKCINIMNVKYVRGGCVSIHHTSARLTSNHTG